MLPGFLQKSGMVAFLSEVKACFFCFAVELLYKKEAFATQQRPLPKLKNMVSDDEVSCLV